MLAQERHEIIMNLIDKNKIVKVSEMVQKFDVSIETIRRDLEYLEKQGVLKRVYGGAVPAKTFSKEPSYSTREIVNLYEKQCIAEKTVELINDGETIILDLGTTTLEVAKCLKVRENLTIITNSIKAALELQSKENFKVYFAGGLLRPYELSCSGFLTANFLKQFNVNKSIIGVGGITLKNGITDYHIEEAQIRKVMIECADKVIAVADNSKFAVKALANVCDLSDIDILVTDSKVHRKVIDSYKNKGIDVKVANVNSKKESI